MGLKAEEIVGVSSLKVGEVGGQVVELGTSSDPNKFVLSFGGRTLGHFGANELAILGEIILEGVTRFEERMAFAPLSDRQLRWYLASCQLMSLRDNFNEEVFDVTARLVDGHVEMTRDELIAEVMSWNDDLTPMEMVETRVKPSLNGEADGMAMYRRLRGRAP
jgi:hypothetical protein